MKTKRHILLFSISFFMSPSSVWANPCEEMVEHLQAFYEELSKEDSNARQARSHKLEATKARQKCLKKNEAKSARVREAITRLGQSPSKAKNFKRALKSSGCFKIPYEDLHRECVKLQQQVNSICKDDVVYAGCGDFMKKRADKSWMERSCHRVSSDLVQMRNTAERIIPELTKCMAVRAKVDAIYTKKTKQRIERDTTLSKSIRKDLLAHLDDGGSHAKEIEHTENKRENCKTAIEQLSIDLRALDQRMPTDFEEALAVRAGCQKLPYPDLQAECRRHQEYINDNCKESSPLGCQALNRRVEEDAYNISRKARETLGEDPKGTVELQRRRANVLGLIKELETAKGKLAECKERRETVNNLFTNRARGRIEANSFVCSRVKTVMKNHLDDGGNHLEPISAFGNRMKKCDNVIKVLQGQLKK